MSENLAPKLSGVDLARVALQAAKAAAKNRPVDAAGGGAATRRVRPSRRTGGRDPITFAAAIDNLVTERAWQAPAAAGSVIDCWADIAPELVGKVQPVHYEPVTRQLDLLPVSPAYATQLRLLGRQLIARINTKTGQETVKELRVLAPGSGAAAPTDTGAEHEGAPAAQAPVKTREMASAGYHQALAAHQTARPDLRADPAIAEAIESQPRALRELSRRAFPDADPGEQLSPIEAARIQRRREAATSHAAALQRARAERKDRTSAQPSAVMEQTA